MSTNIVPLTPHKDYVERLQPLICRTGSGAVGFDNAFCSSDPKDWPTITVNGAGMTRIVFEEGDEKESVPGVPYLCSTYINWSMRSGCGVLAAEIIADIATANHCPASADLDEFVSKILGGIPANRRRVLKKIIKNEARELVGPYEEGCRGLRARVDALKAKMEKRCEIMFDTNDEGQKVFNEGRAEDLLLLGSRCQERFELDFNRAKVDGGGLSWKAIVGGTSAVSLLAAIALIAHRIFRAIRKTGTTVKQVGKGATDLADGVDNFAKGIKKLLGTSLPNLWSAIKYVFSFRWLRGERPPPDRHYDATPTTAPQPAAPAAHPEAPARTLIIEPAEEVVATQLRNLVQSDRYEAEGQRFATLSEVAQRYLAYEAINRWWMLPEQKKTSYIESDSLLTEGKLPIGFLLDFASRFLSERMLPLIEGSAVTWAKRRGRFTEIRLLDAKLRLIEDDRYFGADATVQDYVARFAIAKWDSMPPDARQAFISATEVSDNGMPTDEFLQYFRAELRNIDQIGRQAMVYAQIIYTYPDLITQPFAFLDTRTSLLIHAWDLLLDAAKREFWLIDGNRSEATSDWQLPTSFIEFMQNALQIGTTARTEAQPAATPWTYDTAEHTVYKGYHLCDVMREITDLDREMASFPDILGQRARSTIESWVLINEAIKRQYALEDQVAGRQWTEGDIPLSYIKFWFEVNRSIGTTARGSLHHLGPQTSLPDTGASSDPTDGKGHRGGGSPPAQGTPQMPPPPSNGSRNGGLFGAAARGGIAAAFMATVGLPAGMSQASVISSLSGGMAGVRSGMAMCARIPALPPSMPFAGFAF